VPVVAEGLLEVGQSHPLPIVRILFLNKMRTIGSWTVDAFSLSQVDV